MEQSAVHAGNLFAVAKARDRIRPLIVQVDPATMLHAADSLIGLAPQCRLVGHASRFLLVTRLGDIDALCVRSGVLRPLDSPLSFFRRHSRCRSRYSLSRCLAPISSPGMKWRLIGPFRGGRVTAVAGVPGDPTTYYFGTPGGGVWKSTNGGRVWLPIFDSVPVPSIGARDRSALGRRTSSTSAPASRRAARVSIAPTTAAEPGAARVLPMCLTSRRSSSIRGIPTSRLPAETPSASAFSGPPVPKSASVDNRGIFRTEDGGKSWKKVYNNDATFGVVDMCSDPGQSEHPLRRVVPSGIGLGRQSSAADFRHREVYRRRHDLGADDNERLA